MIERDSMTVSRDQQMKEGRRRLKNLLGRAKADVRKRGRSLEMQPLSVLAQSLTGRITKRNFDALIAYEDGEGRWFGDLVLKNMPTGMPDAMGTPSNEPRATRDAALKDAYGALLAMLANIEEAKRASFDKPPVDERVFVLYGFSFKIPGHAVDAASELFGLVDGGETYSLEQSVYLMTRAVREISGEAEFTGDLYDAAPQDAKTQLLAAMATMMIFGFFRFPESLSDISGEKERRS